MPKHSLKRRHQRHHDLSLCWQDYSGDFLTRDAAARMVSDEDIRQTSSETQSPPTNERQNTLVTRLARPSSSMKLSELVSSQSFADDETIIQLSPKSFIGQNKERQGGSQPVSPSPWGHFVDMLCPSSPHEYLSTTQTHDLSICESSYVPCCPSPQSRSKQESRHFHPYDPSCRVRSKRFPVSSQSIPAREVKGFVLRVPDESCGGLIQEAENAFLGLSL